MAHTIRIAVVKRYDLFRSSGNQMQNATYVTFSPVTADREDQKVEVVAEAAASPCCKELPHESLSSPTSRRRGASSFSGVHSRRRITPGHHECEANRTIAVVRNSPALVRTGVLATCLRIDEATLSRHGGMVVPPYQRSAVGRDRRHNDGRVWNGFDGGNLPASKRWQGTLPFGIIASETPSQFANASYSLRPFGSRQQADSQANHIGATRERSESRLRSERPLLARRDPSGRQSLSRPASSLGVVSLLGSRSVASVARSVVLHRLSRQHDRQIGVGVYREGSRQRVAERASQSSHENQQGNQKSGSPATRRTSPASTTIQSFAIYSQVASSREIALDFSPAVAANRRNRSTEPSRHPCLAENTRHAARPYGFNVCDRNCADGSRSRQQPHNRSELRIYRSGFGSANAAAVLSTSVVPARSWSATAGGCDCRLTQSRPLAGFQSKTTPQARSLQRPMTVSSDRLGADGFFVLARFEVINGQR